MSGAIPHGIVENHHSFLRNLSRPLLILFHNLERVLPPDNTVTGRDHANRKVQCQHLFNLFRYHAAEGSEDVSIVFHRFLVELLLVDLIIKSEGIGIVLAEGVIGHEDIIPGQVGEHAVRPVEHGCLHKDELSLTDTDLISGLDCMEVPGLVVMSLYALQPPLGDNHRSFGGMAHHGRKSSGVVCLGMIGNHDVNPGRVDNFTNVLNKLLLKGPPYRIHEHGLLIGDEIRIV
ncbi:hypothetical protein ES703_24163 [subsurface metagenome]